jgi:hypothetical protein
VSAETVESMLDFSVRVSSREAYVSPTRDMVAARRFFESAIAGSGTTPSRVITDKAASYPPAPAAVVPGVLHRTGRYRTNRVERDHGFLKERLRPRRGLKSVASAAIFTSGHALIATSDGFLSALQSVPAWYSLGYGFASRSPSDLRSVLGLLRKHSPRRL